MDNATSKRVLIVEDDMLLSFVEERILKKLGYQVVDKATTGADAISKACELNPDVIIMDIQLKGEMDGIEAMNKIRKSSNIPVIYLSGNSDRANYKRAEDTNFAGYLVKPVTAKDLKQPLEKVFNNQVKEYDSKHKRSSFLPQAG